MRAMDIDVAARNRNVAEARKLAAHAALVIAIGEIVWRRNEKDKAAEMWEEAGALYADALRQLPP